MPEEWLVLAWFCALLLMLFGVWILILNCCH